MGSEDVAKNALVIASNVAFLLPAFYCCVYLKKYLSAFVYFSVFFTSTLYHCCKFGAEDFAAPGGFCFLVDFDGYFALDHLFAVLTVPTVLLSFTPLDVTVFDFRTTERKENREKNAKLFRDGNPVGETISKTIAGSFRWRSRFKPEDELDSPSSFPFQEKEKKRPRAETRVLRLKEPDIAQSRSFEFVEASSEDCVPATRIPGENSFFSVGTHPAMHEDPCADSESFMKTLGYEIKPSSEVFSFGATKTYVKVRSIAKTRYTGTNLYPSLAEGEKKVLKRPSKELEGVYICSYAYLLGVCLLISFPGTALIASVCISSLALSLFWGAIFYFEHGLTVGFDKGSFLLGTCFVLIAGILMVIQDGAPSDAYWAVHSLWHVLGAVGPWLLLKSKYRYACLC